MISSEITTTERGSRLLHIRFTDAGEPVKSGVPITIPVVRCIQYAWQDAEGNLAELEICLPDDSDYWPAEQFIAHIGWHGKVSDENIAALREAFPYPWRRTGSTHVDSPIPDHVMCDVCGTHKGEVFWLGDKEPDWKYAPFWYEDIRCHCCTWKAQLEYAEKELEKFRKWIPELQAKLSAGCKKEEARD